MASISPYEPTENLLLTLPPELRNVIYAMVITSDFYELDPTISVKTFPRPRYGMLNIKRGIKAQGGTPSIAKTCQQIRTEALDVYYGRNTFALVGDDSTSAKRTYAIANRIAAHEWMQLIGDDAKYLRKVRFLLVLDRQQTIINLLITIASNSNGDVPLVTALPDASRPVQFGLEGFSRQLEALIGKHLAETEDMGKMWQAMIERALYSAQYAPGVFDFDVSDEAIEAAAARASKRKSKSAATPKQLPRANLGESSDKDPEGRAMSPKPSFDSDCMEVEAPAKKAEVPKLSASTAKNRPHRFHDIDSDVVELAPPFNKPKARKRASNAMQVDKMAREMNLPIAKASAPGAATGAVPEAENDYPDVMEFEATMKTLKTAKKLKASEPAPTAGTLTEAGGIDIGPKAATRASTRKKMTRKL